MHNLVQDFIVKVITVRSDFLYDLKKNLNILAKCRRYFSISFLGATVGGQTWLSLSI